MAADPEALQDELRALERRRTRALVERDLPMLEALHAPEYELVTPAGRVLGREHYLAAIAREPFYAGWEADAIAVRVAGDSAVLRYQARLRFPSGRELHCWHLDTYERRDGRWQAVWSQATELRPAPPPGAILPAIEALETERLRLQPVSAAHLDDLMAVSGDPEVTHFLPYATWAGRADAEAWLARVQTLEAGGSARQLVILSRADGRAIGTLLLFRHDAGSRRIELGYVLGRAHWHQGLMHEAAAAACAHAFGPLGLRRIEAEADPDNLASCRLLERLGFRREGRMRQRWTAKGRTYDTCLFGLLAGDGR